MLWTLPVLAFATYLLYVPITRGWIFVVWYLGAIPFWLVIVPLVMRDVWRKNRSHDDSPIVLPPELKPPEPGESIHDRKAPPRW